MLLELVHGWNTGILPRQNVRHELILASLRDVDDRRGKIDSRVVNENACNLIQLYSLSPDLRLPVEASVKFDLSVQPPDSAITWGELSTVPSAASGSS